MGFLDKAKAAAEQAAQKAKEGAELAAHKAKETAEDVQTKRELSGVYDELGHKAFELVESGAVANDALTPLVSRIKELQAKLDGAGDTAPAAGETGTPA